MGNNDTMTFKKIQLSGHIDVPKHRLAAITAALPEHIRLTRAETGCISFDVCPDPDHAGRFHVAEVFISKLAFDLHQSRTAMSDWARVANGIARSYQIEETY